ncbi:protein of unknown function [Burkholderia multivorans]
MPLPMVLPGVPPWTTDGGGIIPLAEPGAALEPEVELDPVVLSPCFEHPAPSARPDTTMLATSARHTI